MLTAKEIRSAIRQGDADQTMKLIEANPHLLQMMTPFGTWLHVAASFGSLDIVKQLLALGIPINALGGTFDSGALRLAASHGHIDIVAFLIISGAELDVSKPEKNPLFGAIYGGHINIVKLLIENGIDIRMKYTGEYMKNMDALAFAEERGQQEIADFLRQKLSG